MRCQPSRERDAAATAERLAGSAPHTKAAAARGEGLGAEEVQRLTAQEIRELVDRVSGQ